MPSPTVSLTANRKKGMLCRVRRISQGPVPWLAPLLLLLAVFFLFSIVELVRMSFTNSTMDSNSFHYTLNSYRRVFTDSSFPQILGVTFFFVTFSVVFQFILGFVIALAVDSGELLGMRGTVIARTVALISWSVPGVVIGIIWNILYNESPSGIINYLLSFFHINAIPFFSNQYIALLAVSIANVWRGTAQGMILMYAGLKTVSRDMIEAADVDGANAWTKLFEIIIPAIRPIIVINILLNIINTFNTFDMVISLTNGGPGHGTEVLVLHSYNTTFQNLDLGKGAAIAVVLLAINILMSVIYVKISKEKEG
jgi:multiple sugar transport system permease protein